MYSKFLLANVLEVFSVYFFVLIVWCWMFREEAEGKMKGILGYVEEDVDSLDFIGDSRYGLYKVWLCTKFGFYWSSCQKACICTSRRFRWGE